MKVWDFACLSANVVEIRRYVVCSQSIYKCRHETFLVSLIVDILAVRTKRVFSSGGIPFLSRKMRGAAGGIVYGQANWGPVQT